jgi:hypothetical protein
MGGVCRYVFELICVGLRLRLRLAEAEAEAAGWINAGAG